MTRPSILGLAVLLFASSLAATADRQTYAVRQFRPSKVGDTFDVDVTADQTRRAVRTTHGEQPTTRELVKHIELGGHCSVEAVDGRGAPTTVRCEVSKSALTIDGKAYALLPAGFVFDAVGTDQGTAFKGVDDPLPRGVEPLLPVLLSVYKQDEPTPDDVFPTQTDHAVGESWPMDPAQYAAVAKAERWPVPTKASGHATLTRVATVAGQPCLEVEYVQDLDGLTPSTRPTDVTVGTRHDLTKETVVLPRDGTAPAVKFDFERTMLMEDHGTDVGGKPFEEQKRYVTKVRLTHTPTPP